jgi:hypothetical protein
MKKKLEYRLLNTIDVNKVNLLNDIGDRNWLREFFSSYKPNSILVGCFDNDKIVGCEGYVSYKLIKDGKIVQTHRSERTLVNPEYRGMGIFESLVHECDLQAVKSQSHFSWGATSALKPFQRAGFNSETGFRTYLFIPIKKVWYKRGFKIISLFKLLKPTIFNGIFRKRDLNLIKAFLSELSVVKGMRYSNSGEIKFKDIDLVQLSTFQKNNHNEYYQIKIDEDFIQWLKLANDYEFIQLESEGLCCGYLVLKINPKNNYITIVDIIISNLEIVEVVSQLSKLDKFQEYDSFFLALNSLNNLHYEYIYLLNKAGVLNKTKAGSFVIKPLCAKGVQLSDLLLTDIWLEL